MFSTLRARIVLVAASAVAVMGLLIFGITRHAVHQASEDAEQRASALSRMLAQAPLALAGAREGQALNRLLPLIGARDPSLLFVELTDRQGQTTWVRPESEGGPGGGDIERLHDTGYRGRPDWKRIDVTLKDPAGQTQVRLHAVFSLASLRSAALRDEAFAAFWFALLGAAVMASAWWVAGRMVRPLETIAGELPNAEQGQSLEIAKGGGREVEAVARAVNRLAGEMRSRVRLQNNFARFVSEPVAHKVISDDLTVRLGGERRLVTVLFADIRGFTSFASTQPPERVVTMLNDYFQRMADLIPRFGGTLDKFMGDALMAVFNAPATLENHEICAVTAAVEMVRVMREINERRRAAGETELRLGIGINTGEAVAGTFGSEKRLEYTVIGAAVNLAQRIESHARNGEVLIGESTFQAVRHLVDVIPHESVELRGIPQPVRLYQLIQFHSGEVSSTPHAG